MNIEYLQQSVLKNGQEKAFFTYDKLFDKEIVKLDALSKTISAMANAIGGIVYIGLEIKKSRFVAFETAPKGWPSSETLLLLLKDEIQPKINNLKIEKLESAFVITIPDSLQKPHISPNYKFYKRVLSKNQVMEEFEIRQIYQSTLKSDLQIISMTNLQGIPLMSDGLFETMKFYPRIHISNLGQRIEEKYKLEISIPSFLVDETFTVLHKYLKGYKKDKNIYSIPATEPLFQNENKTVIELVLKLNSENYTRFVDSEIELRLFSSEKVHEQTYKCADWFNYKGNLPQLNHFTKKLKE
jgi:hypothetical protein